MRIAITSADDDGSAITELYDWLRQDLDLRRTARVEWAAPQQTGGATGALQVVDVVLGQGMAALNLALSYASWRTARPAAAAVTITFPGGTVTVHDGSDETVRRIVQVLRAANSAGTPDALDGAGGGSASGPAGAGSGAGAG